MEFFGGIEWLCCFLAFRKLLVCREFFGVLGCLKLLNGKILLIIGHPKIFLVIHFFVFGLIRKLSACLK
jgi:hypothetical protein